MSVESSINVISHNTIRVNAVNNKRIMMTISGSFGSQPIELDNEDALKLSCILKAFYDINKVGL